MAFLEFWIFRFWSAEGLESPVEGNVQHYVWFVKILNDVVMEPILLCFSWNKWWLRHSGLVRVVDYDSYCRTSTCLLCIFVPPFTSLIKLVNAGSFTGLCHCSYIFVSCLAFRVHIAGNMNKKLSFVIGVLSTSFAIALLGLVR